MPLSAPTHPRQHALDSASDHTGVITDAQHGSRGSGLHGDSHARQHALDSAADHSGVATVAQLVNAPLATKTYSAPSRALDTVYQNTSGYPILVLVSVKCRPVANVVSSAFGKLQIASSTPPTDIVSVAGISENIALGNFNPDIEGTLVGIVPNNWYYRVASVVSGGGTVTLDNWREY